MLDDLLGSGAWTDLQAALAPPASSALTVSAAQVETADGVRVYVEWQKDGASVGSMKFDVRPGGGVHFPTLAFVPAFRRAGVFSKLCSDLCDYLQARGVTAITASPANDYASWVLQLPGFVPVGDRLRMAVTGTNSRRRQYVRWKRGLAAEPQWHVDLKASPPPVQPTALPEADD